MDDVRSRYGTRRKFGVAVPLAVIGLCLSCFPAKFAEGHNADAKGGTRGITIPNIAHGQAGIMAEYRDAVLALAGKQVSPDAKLRTLLNFTNLQFTYCLWGLVPGSLSNEESAFNSCSHAYLAATRELLLHLQIVADDHQAAERLAETINMKMLLSGTALQLCRNSLGNFSTAEIIYPVWADIRVNPILAVLVLSLMAAAMGMGLMRPVADASGHAALNRDNRDGIKRDEAGPPD